MEGIGLKLEMKMGSILEMAPSFELVCMNTLFQKLDKHLITDESGGSEKPNGLHQG